MVLINKQPKLSCHMASMPINDRRLIQPIMLICFCSAKFLLKGVNIVLFSNDHNIVSSLICGRGGEGTKQTSWRGGGEGTKQTSYGTPGSFSSNV